MTRKRIFMLIHFVLFTPWFIPSAVAQFDDPLTNFATHVDEGRRADAQRMLDDALSGKITFDLQAAAGWVARKGEVNMLRQLLDHGVDPDGESWGDGTVVTDAAEMGQVETLRLLLDRGGDPQPGLMQAAERGRAEAVKMLLENGAKAESANEYGYTPLHAAAEKWGARGEAVTVDVVRLLISHGADVNARTSSGVTPLYYAAKTYPAVVALLLEHGADPNLEWSMGTPLKQAITAYVDDEEKRVELVRLLLEAGADPNRKVHYGTKLQTPLELAQRQERAYDDVTGLSDLIRAYGGK